MITVYSLSSAGSFTTGTGLCTIETGLRSTETALLSTETVLFSTETGRLGTESYTTRLGSGFKTCTLSLLLIIPHPLEYN